MGEIPPHERRSRVSQKARGREGRNHKRKRQKASEADGFRRRHRDTDRYGQWERDRHRQMRRMGERLKSGRERTEKQPFGRIAVGEVTRPFGIGDTLWE